METPLEYSGICKSDTAVLYWTPRVFRVFELEFGNIQQWAGKFPHGPL